MSILRRSVLARVLVYYIVALSVWGALLHFVAPVGRAITFERARQARSLVTEPGVRDVLRGVGEQQLLDVNPVLALTASLLCALTFAIPVAWVYRATKTHRTYDKAEAQTLLLLPIAIATVVFLVKESLALAFGLAGIVAAIRFRHTLEDVKDAVFMFVVIGIGLASGAQLLTVAALASLIFSLTALAVRRAGFGRQSDGD